MSEILPPFTFGAAARRRFPALAHRGTSGANATRAMSSELAAKITYEHMGYDLVVYTRTPVEGPEQLLAWRDWAESNGGWVSKERRWQVVVNASRTISAEDALVEPLLKVQPEVAFLTEINVEGRQAQGAFAVATLTALKLAKEREGAILDWQMGAMIVPLAGSRCANNESMTDL